MIAFHFHFLATESSPSSYQWPMQEIWASFLSSFPSSYFTFPLYLLNYSVFLGSTSQIPTICPYRHNVNVTTIVPVITTSHSDYVLFAFVVFLSFFRAALTAYGGSQARGPIRAMAAGLGHCHSHVESEPQLRPTLQLRAMLDP